MRIRKEVIIVIARMAGNIILVIKLAKAVSMMLMSAQMMQPFVKMPVMDLEGHLPEESLRPAKTMKARMIVSVVLDMCSHLTGVLKHFKPLCYDSKV